MKQTQMKEFLESKGIKIHKIEGDDFSSVFHVSEESRKMVNDNQAKYEIESGCVIATSDSFGMSVVVMENDDSEDDF